MLEGGEAVALAADECVLLPDGQAFRLTNDLAMPATPFADLREIDWRGGIATVNGGGETVILGGHFAFAGVHAEVLSGAIPPVAHLSGIRDKANLRWALEQMRHELMEARPGSVLVAQHLAHMVLVQALRLYLSGQAGRHVGWLFALADPQLAAVIGAIHADPGARWTLPALASVAGMSRTRFARVFKAAVGSSPVDYLTSWRMLLAAARLANGDRPISTIASSLGYDSESAFSTAFKRVMGCSPRRYPCPTSSSSSHPWPMTAIARRAGGRQGAAAPFPVVDALRLANVDQDGTLS